VRVINVVVRREDGARTYGVYSLDERGDLELIQGGFRTKREATSAAAELLSDIAEDAERAAGWDSQP
jgi:hypothetical protein